MGHIWGLNRRLDEMNNPEAHSALWYQSLEFEDRGYCTSDTVQFHYGPSSLIAVILLVCRRMPKLKMKCLETEKIPCARIKSSNTLESS